MILQSRTLATLLKGLPTIVRNQWTIVDKKKWTKVTRVSQKFCNILITWGTIWQLLVFLPRSWKWWTILGREMLTLPDTLQVQLAVFVFMAWSTVSESMFLELVDFAWLLRFLQPKQNILNYLLTVLWLTALSSFAQQMFLVALCPSSNLWSISF